MKSKSSRFLLVGVILSICTIVQILYFEPIYYYITQSNPFLYLNHYRQDCMEITFSNILLILLNTTLCILLFMQRDGIELCTILSLKALHPLISMINHFSQLDYYDSFVKFAHQLPYLIKFSIYIFIALLIFLANKQIQSILHLSKFASIVKSISFIPFILLMFDALYEPFIVRMLELSQSLGLVDDPNLTAWDIYSFDIRQYFNFSVWGYFTVLLPRFLSVAGYTILTRTLSQNITPQSL